MICYLLALRPILHITQKTLSYLHSTKVEQMTKTMVIILKNRRHFSLLHSPRSSTITNFRPAARAYSQRYHLLLILAWLGKEFCIKNINFKLSGGSKNGKLLISELGSWWAPLLSHRQSDHHFTKDTGKRKRHVGGLHWQNTITYSPEASRFKGLLASNVFVLNKELRKVNSVMGIDADFNIIDT